MNAPDDIEAQRELARRMFPREWAATLAPGLPGDRRRNRQASLRQRAKAEQIMAPLRERGECCATCLAYIKVPLSSDRACDDRSDWQGYAITKPGSLCPSWRGRS